MAMTLRSLILLFMILSWVQAVDIDRPAITDRDGWLRLINHNNETIRTLWARAGVGIDPSMITDPVTTVSNGGLSLHGFGLPQDGGGDFNQAITRREIWLEWMEDVDHAKVWHTYPNEFYSHYFADDEWLMRSDLSNNEPAKRFIEELLRRIGDHVGSLKEMVVQNNDKMQELVGEGSQNTSAFATSQVELSQDQQAQFRDLQGGNAVLRTAIYTIEGKAKAFWGQVKHHFDRRSKGLSDALETLAAEE